MKLLLMDTCGASGSVALAYGAQIVAQAVLPGRSASERLVPMVRSLLEGQGWRVAELTAIVVVHGPGSFTGVRIGLSAAKGLSEAVGMPLVAVSRLAVLVSMGRQSAALDAGRGEFYVRDETGVESLVTLEELLAVVGAGEVVVCEARAAEAIQPTLGYETAEGGAPRVWVRMVAEPMASDALGIALERVAAGQFDDAATVDANYLRRTEGLFWQQVAR